MFYLFHSINKSQTCSSVDICDHCSFHVNDEIEAVKLYLGGKVGSMQAAILAATVH